MWKLFLKMNKLIKMYRNIIITLAFIVFSGAIYSQNLAETSNEENLSISTKIVGGFHLGASVPLPVPNRITNFSWSPTMAPYIGALISLQNLETPFGISTGAIIAYKGMNAGASVYQIYTEVEIDGVQTKGYFTGRNETHVNNCYLIFPVKIFFSKPRYKINLGVDLSYAIQKEFQGAVKDGYLRVETPIGERIDITYAEYSFDDEVRSFDIAAVAGYERKIYNNFWISASLNWSLTSLLNSDFSGISYKMYNIYANIGLVYYIGKNR
jgi:hypothetical protein